MTLTNVYANSYIVVDGEDETIYKQENMNSIQSIASVSKVMTAIVAIENGDLSDSWIVKDEIENQKKEGKDGFTDCIGDDKTKASSVKSATSSVRGSTDIEQSDDKIPGEQR